MKNATVTFQKTETREDSFKSSRAEEKQKEEIFS